MLALFDHGTPRGLIHALPKHTVFTAQSKGWDRFNNGALLAAAEAAGFDDCSRLTPAFAISKTWRSEPSPSSC